MCHKRRLPEEYKLHGTSCHRDFTLMPALGHPVQLSAYRGRSNLVLICADEQAETEQLLLGLASQYTEIRNEEAEVLVAVRSPAEATEKKEQLKLPYPILVDHGTAM